MMMRIAMLADLAAFTIVVSQPLFYVVVMTPASRALSATTYIELRHHMNRVMNRRAPMIYVAALTTTLLVLVLAYRSSSWLVLVSTAVALLCLAVDVFFMLRVSLPINNVVDGWSAASYPPDWEEYRRKWFEVFVYREIVLFVGLAALLIGAVFRC